MTENTALDRFQAAASAQTERIQTPRQTISPCRQRYRVPDHRNGLYTNLTDGETYVAIPFEVTAGAPFPGSAKTPACDRFLVHLDLYDSHAQYVASYNQALLMTDAQCWMHTMRDQVLLSLAASTPSDIMIGDVAARVKCRLKGKYPDLRDWTAVTMDEFLSDLPELTPDEWWQSLSAEERMAVMTHNTQAQQTEKPAQVTQPAPATPVPTADPDDAVIQYDDIDPNPEPGWIVYSESGITESDKSDESEIIDTDDLPF